MKKYLISIIVGVLFSSMLVAGSPKAYMAGAATFSLSGSGSYNQGSTVLVSVNENSNAETVNSVQADVVFDASKLQYLGFTAGGMNCPVVMPGAGSVSLGCLISGGTVTGSQSVGTISFKALSASGSTAVSLAQSSMIVHPVDQTSSSDIWNHANVSATITFTTMPVSPPQPNPNPTPPLPSNPKPMPLPSPNVSQTALVSNSDPVSSDQKANDVTVLGAQVLTEPVAYRVIIKVVNTKGAAIGNAKVTINGRTVVTDMAGIANFNSVVIGFNTVFVQAKNYKSTERQINVTADNQREKIELQSARRSFLFWFFIGSSIITAGGALFVTSRKNKGTMSINEEAGKVSPLTEPLVVAPVIAAAAPTPAIKKKTSNTSRKNSTSSRSKAKKRTVKKASKKPTRNKK